MAASGNWERFSEGHGSHWPAGRVLPSRAKTLETSMLLHRLLAVLLGIFAFAAAFAVCAHWMVDAQTGLANAWVIVPFFWAPAILAMLVHYVAQWRLPVSRILSRLKPFAGSNAGVQLPG
jgi:hypothetical protein